MSNKLDVVAKRLVAHVKDPEQHTLELEVARQTLSQTGMGKVVRKLYAEFQAIDRLCGNTAEEKRLSKHTTRR